MEKTFRAFQVKVPDGQVTRSWEDLPMQDLPENDLRIKVDYSSLNYKDALSASGNKGVTRKYPHVPGVDAAGTVISSNNSVFPIGTKVIVTGFDLGMNTWGGYGEIISVPAAWAIPMPPQADSRMAMCISILAKLGFEVVAISGKADTDFLINTLGATEIIERKEFVNIYNSKALSRPEFAAAIDTVGGEVLSGLLKTTKYGGTVTCCGMVNSAELLTSIFPFILRGVELAGIDSVEIPVALRNEIWPRLLTDWYPENTEKLITEIDPDQLAEKLDQLLAGQAKGRFIFKHR